MQMQRILPDQLENFTIATNDLFFSRSPHMLSKLSAKDQELALG